MTGEELEKLHTLTHYRDVAGQAQAERRQGLTDRRTVGDGRLAALELIAAVAGQAQAERRQGLTDRRTVGDGRLAALELIAAKGCLQYRVSPEVRTCRDTLTIEYWCSPCIATAALVGP